VAAALAEEVQLARRLLKEETLHRRALEQVGGVVLCYLHRCIYGSVFCLMF
jgi:hypothetical protein